MRNDLTPQEFMGQFSVGYSQTNGHQQWKPFNINNMKLINDQIKLGPRVKGDVWLFNTSNTHGPSIIKTSYKFVNYYERIALGHANAYRKIINESSGLDLLPDKTRTVTLNNVEISSLSLLKTQYRFIMMTNVHRFKSFEGIYEKVEMITVDECNDLIDLGGIPEEASLMILSIKNCPGITSFKNLHKCESLITGNLINANENVLHIFIQADSWLMQSSSINSPVLSIVYKYFDTKTIYDAAAALIEAGYDKAAEL